MRIAMIGIRGVPARYGGFETAVEEIGRRLADSGHEVTVYCRGERHSEREYLGMRLVHLPALRLKQAETLSHTGFSVMHAAWRRLTRRGPDVALVFNSANSPMLPVLRAMRVPIGTNVDGLEWKRTKWSGAGQRYYLAAEAMAVRWSDALIADSPGIQEYYLDKFQADSVYLPYGAPIVDYPDEDKLRENGYEPGGYHLVVARFEPENHVHLAVEGYRASNATKPLVVVGSAPYGDYTSKLHELAGDDPRIRFPGGVWDQDLLDSLYAGAFTYVHGHSVGGTNPSLLRAMGAGAPTIAYDVNFNREVLGDSGRYFPDATGLTGAIEAAEADPGMTADLGEQGRKRAAERYVWDDVAAGYERLCFDLAERRLTRATLQAGRRSRWRSEAHLVLPGDDSFIRDDSAVRQ